MLHDSTNSKIENSLERLFSKKHLDIFDMIDEVIIIFLTDSIKKPGQIIYANKMAVKLLGYSPEALYKKSFYDLTKDIPIDAKSHEKKKFNCELIAFSGSRIPILSSMNFMEHAGRSLGIFIGEDSSEIVKLLKELQWRIDFESLIGRVSSMFVGLFDFDDAVNKALEEIGAFTGADRAYLFLFDKNGKTMSNTHEWCAEGIKPEMEKLQNLPADMFPWWIRKLRSGKILNIPEVVKLPEEASTEKEILLAQNIKSLIVLPVFTGKKLVGFVGLDDVDRDTPWQESDMRLLRVLSDIISKAFEAKGLRQ